MNYSLGRILNLRTGVISPQHHVMYDELFSTVQGSLTDAVFDRITWTKLLELNGLELTLDPADSRGTTVPFQEFYENFVDLTSDDVTSSPSVPEGDTDTNSTDLNSSEDDSSPVIATSGSDDRVFCLISLLFYCSYLIEVHRLFFPHL